MNRNVTETQERTDPRATYQLLGVDERDAHHLLDRATGTVHIVHAGGARGRRLLDGGDVDDYVDAVADAIGWSHRRWYGTLADAMADRIEVQV